MIKRRTILSAPMLTNLAGAFAAPGGSNQYIDLTFYHLSGNQSERLLGFLENEHLPMTRRAGIGRVGYFGLRETPESARAAAQKRGEVIPEPRSRIVTLMVYDSWPAVEQKRTAQRADKRWTDVVEAQLGQPPLFDRMESWLLRTFDGIPKIEVPPAAGGNKSHIYDLRIAETPNLGAQDRKIAMWNEGEIQIFRNCRLHPVFFGETVAGSRMPNFWFMVWFDGPEAREEAWGAFWKDPDWAKMQKDPRYKGASTRTTDTFLESLAFSPIR
jgi:hypothetical protein